MTKFAHDVITVGDNVERAIAAVPARAAEQDPALKSFLEGVRMTERELVNVLERHGIKRMSPQGEAFNPHQHQAVMEAHDESVPAGTVVQVLQAGYTIEDRTLRPAMVAVAKGGAKPARQTEAAGDAAPTAANDDNPDQFGAEADPAPKRARQYLSFPLLKVQVVAEGWPGHPPKRQIDPTTLGQQVRGPGEHAIYAVIGVPRPSGKDNNIPGFQNDPQLRVAALQAADMEDGVIAERDGHDRRRNVLPRPHRDGCPYAPTPNRS